jgi:hypothetical protein
MRRARFTTAVLASVAVGVVVSAPAQAAPVRVQESPVATIAVMSDALTGVLFVNSSRAAYCTTARLAYEQAIYDWSQVPDNPAPQPQPPADAVGAVPGAATYDEVRPGVFVYTFSARGLPTEVWAFNSSVIGGGPLVGPCVDSQGGAGRIATGNGTWNAGDNNRFGTTTGGPGTRGNAFFDRITASFALNGTTTFMGSYHNRVTPGGAYRFSGGDYVVAHA